MAGRLAWLEGSGEGQVYRDEVRGHIVRCARQRGLMAEGMGWGAEVVPTYQVLQACLHP
jgi:hypothetical protein